jgi:hypothetical protein
MVKLDMLIFANIQRHSTWGYAAAAGSGWDSSNAETAGEGVRPVLFSPVKVAG